MKTRKAEACSFSIPAATQRKREQKKKSEQMRNNAINEAECIQSEACSFSIPVATQAQEEKENAHAEETEENQREKDERGNSLR
jgi:hypothetical protein